MVVIGYLHFTQDDSLLAKWVPTGTSSQAAAPSVRVSLFFPIWWMAKLPQVVLLLCSVGGARWRLGMASIGSAQTVQSTSKLSSALTASTGAHSPLQLEVSNLSLSLSLSLSSDHQTPHHSQDHEMLPRALPTGLADQDYAQFSQTTNREYNYLDPNFCPAS